MVMPRGESDFLHHPLDDALGTRAGVRLLRLLTYEVDVAVSAPEAADRTGITAAAARRAFEDLVRTGFVLRSGAGRVVQYQANAREPLVQALCQVFGAEAERYDAFIKGLRALFDGVPEVLSAWIEHSPKAPGAAMEVTAVAETSSIPWIGRDLRAALSSLEGSADQVIELAVFSPAEAPTPELETVIPLSGTLSVQWPAARRADATHAATDDRSMRMSAAIVQLLREDPSLAARALRHVGRLLRDDQGAAAGDLLEWKQLLEAYSPERLSGFLVSASSRAARLRQSSPFLAVLSFAERERLLELLEEAK